MSEMTGPGRCGVSPRSEGRSREVAALVARSQRLAQTPRPVGGRPLAWYVESYYVGDFAALAAVRARG